MKADLTMADLREEVARRLYGCAGGTGWESVDALNRTPYLLLATECIRLMEWARFNESGTVDPYDGTDSRTMSHEPLTLPPDSWRA